MAETLSPGRRFSDAKVMIAPSSGGGVEASLSFDEALPHPSTGKTAAMIIDRLRIEGKLHFRRAEGMVTPIRLTCWDSPAARARSDPVRLTASIPAVHPRVNAGTRATKASPRVRRDARTGTLTFVRIWVDSWQMQCCGTALAIGIDASFQVMTPDRSFLSPILGEEIVSAIDWAEERHSPERALHVVAGRVTGIDGAWCRYQLREDGRMYEPVSGSGRTEGLDSADGFENAGDDESFMGYVVEIR